MVLTLLEKLAETWPLLAVLLAFMGGFVLIVFRSFIRRDQKRDEVIERKDDQLLDLATKVAQAMATSNEINRDSVAARRITNELMRETKVVMSGLAGKIDHLMMRSNK